MPTDPIEQITDTLEAAASAEQSLARLYRACAARWPDDAAFWQRLERDEVEHAEKIAGLAQRVRQEPRRFSAGRPLTAVGIRSFSTYVDSMAENVVAGVIGDEQIFIIARDIEQSLIEQRIPDVARTNDVEYSGLARELLAETRAHRDAIEGRIAKPSR